MSSTNDCAKGADMPDIWGIIVIVVILMVIYGYISSKLSDRKKRKIREKSVPQIADSLKPDTSYNVFLSDGHSFENVIIMGSVEGDDAEFSFAGWDGMLVLKKEDQNKIYLKKTSIRFIEEA